VRKAGKPGRHVVSSRKELDMCHRLDRPSVSDDQFREDSLEPRAREVTVSRYDEESSTAADDLQLPVDQFTVLCCLYGPDEPGMGLVPDSFR
jgi:hypothetical protein